MSRARLASLAAALLALLVAGALGGCGAAAAGGGAAASQPVGKDKLELRLISQNEAQGTKVPTWDGKFQMSVDGRVWLTQADIKEIKLGKLPDGAPAIDIQLDQTATLVLEDLTLKNKGRKLAVLVDGKIVIAPVIKDIIEGGKMSITGPSPADTAAIYKRITGK
jgi:preprotein translocase subunit SecD